MDQPVSKNSAKWPSPKVIVGAFVVVGALRLLTLQAGFDRFTTIDTWSNSICAIVGALSGGTIGVLVARTWFAAQGTHSSAKAMKLRQDSFVAWCLCGVIITIGFAAATAWMCASLLGVGAQYSKGSHQSFDATVVSNSPIHLARGMCIRSLELRRDSNGSRVSICLSTRYRSSLATGILESGMPVRVYIEDTWLGTVVESVEPRR